MGKGRTKRRRKQHRMRQNQQVVSQADVCADLRKWMASRSSKSCLACTFNLVPFCFPETGRGLKTKVAIAPGSVLVSIPQCLLVTPDSVLNSHIGPLIKRWRVAFTQHQLLALFLLVEKKRGNNSEWEPFINSLPVDYTLPHYFSQEQLNALPVHVSLVAQRILQRSHHAYKQVLQFCTTHWTETEHWASWESFSWAWCTVCSRSVFLETDKGLEQFLNVDFKDENNMALCPYLDLLNHTSTAKVRAGMNRETGNYEIITDDTYQPHQQVFISYGPHDNRTLFLNYGFTLPHNIHNNVSFSVDDFVKLRQQKEILYWEQKMDALRKHQLLRDLGCTMEGVSWNLMCALKILAMDWDQLRRSERALTEETLSPAVESSARRMAQHLIRHTLSKCQDHVDKIPVDEQLPLPLVLAHSLCMDEIRILTRTLQIINLM